MSKGKKKAASWIVLLQGCGLALGIYLAGVILLALLAVRDIAGESAVVPAIAAVCLLASFTGSSTVVRRNGLPWGKLPSALLASASFAAVLALVGLCCWDTLSLVGSGGILLLCVLGGGILAALIGSRRKPRRVKT